MKKKLAIKQNEGTTLIQTIAFMYWLINSSFLNQLTFSKLVIFMVAIIFSLFVLINALTKFNLNPFNKLLLSICSSIALLFLAGDNIYRVFNYEYAIQENLALANIDILVQYFFVGVSAVYVSFNIMMLLLFFPSNDMPFKRQIRLATDLHVSRYSDIQINYLEAIVGICFSVCIYTLNYVYNILPMNTAIWFVITSLPIFFYFINKIKSSWYNKK